MNLRAPPVSAKILPSCVVCHAMGELLLIIALFQKSLYLLLATLHAGTRCGPLFPIVCALRCAIGHPAALVHAMCSLRGDHHSSSLGSGAGDGGSRV